jgi:predicted enzyme related to lactoylglutathione lyase
MTAAFVWFHNHSENLNESKSFYEKLLGWKPSDGPGGMAMLAGESGPFASLGTTQRGSAGWVPYVEVEDVDAATERAVTLGATILESKRRGPAGEFSVVADPGGAAVALWQKA